MFINFIGAVNDSVVVNSTHIIQIEPIGEDLRRQIEAHGSTEKFKDCNTCLYLSNGATMLVRDNYEKVKQQVMGS
jgi:hypothetical protein